MARAMKLGVEAGRLAFRAGRIPRKAYASASSPLDGPSRLHRESEGRSLRVMMTTREHEPLEATLQRLTRERERGRPRLQRRVHRARPRADARAGAPAPAAALRRAPAHAAQRALARRSRRRRPSARAQGRLAAFVWRHRRPDAASSSTTSTRRSSITSIATSPRTARRSARSRRRSRCCAGSSATCSRSSRASSSTCSRSPLYVDTKDRDTAGRALVVNAAVNALAEDLAKRWESMVAREQRFEARVGRPRRRARRAAHARRRHAAGVDDAEARARATMATTRLATRRAEPVRATSRRSGSGASGAQAPSRRRSTPTSTSGSRTSSADRRRRSARGWRAICRTSTATSDVLDVGCGRGEFLDLLKARGIGARGLDLNHEMVEVCRARGLDVAEADAVGYLDALPDASLGGLFAAQVVEHLQPGYLLRFLELAFHKLRPGAPIVLETLNPACWTAFFDSFIRDITHVWPLHPETLRYLVLASGFSGGAHRVPLPGRRRRIGFRRWPRTSRRRRRTWRTWPTRSTRTSRSSTHACSPSSTTQSSDADDVPPNCRAGSGLAVLARSACASGSGLPRRPAVSSCTRRQPRPSFAPRSSSAG